MPANYDLAGLALPPGNKILYDDKNMPSIMVYVPKFTYARLGLGTSTDTFPAFIINPDGHVDTRLLLVGLDSPDAGCILGKMQGWHRLQPYMAVDART